MLSPRVERNMQHCASIFGVEVNNTDTLLVFCIVSYQILTVVLHYELSAMLSSDEVDFVIETLCTS